MAITRLHHQHSRPSRDPRRLLFGGFIMSAGGEYSRCEDELDPIAVEPDHPK